jgi:tetratricopeptide (TPR) repeat protein
MALSREGHIDEAIANYKQAIKIDPSMATTWANTGLAYIWLKQYDSAALYLSVADDLQPYNAVTLHLLGEAHFALGDLAAAESDWKEARRLRPENLDTHRRLMDLYRQEKRPDAYVDALVRAASIKSAPADLVQEAIDSLRARGESESADRLRDKSQER